MSIEEPLNFADRPVGMRDGYPDFAKHRRRLESRLLEFCEEHEYQMVSSGAFEYVETLLRARPIEQAEDWIQLFDGSGKAIALRPEMTPSIARMAAPLVASGKVPIRWCYAERVYRRTNDPASLSWASGKAAESTQVGVEWIGANTVETDASLLQLCQEAIMTVGIGDAHTVISHALFAPAYLQAVGVPEMMVNGLLDLLTRGDYVGFRQVVLNLGVTIDVLRSLQSLNPFVPDTFQHVFGAGQRRHPLAQKVIQAWEELIALANELKVRQLHHECSFDLTLHRDLSYYTGIVFESFAPGVGAPIALGGRYDDLLRQFGATAPAIGFAFEVERMLAALAKDGWLNQVSQGER